MANHQGRCPGVIIWGGVATPEAAAAFLCSGAKGIVFESLHWQTDLVSADQSLKQRLSRLRPEHTAVVGHDLGVACRFFDKGNSLAVKELKQYADTQFSCEVTEDHRRAFARKVKETVIPALESDLGRQDLVFHGPRGRLCAQHSPNGSAALPARPWRLSSRKSSVSAGRPRRNWIGSQRTPPPGPWEPNIRLFRAP